MNPKPESPPGSQARPEPPDPDASRHPAVPGWLGFKQSSFLGLVVLTALAVFFCYALVRPFLSATLWAISFAVLANPFHRWLLRRVKNGSLAAGISVVVVGIVLVLPTVALAPKLAGDGAAVVNSIARSIESGQWEEKLGKVKAVSLALTWIESNVDFREVAREIARHVTTGVSSIVAGSVAGVLQLLVSGFLLFYLFRDQREALAALRSVLPITTKEADMLFHRFSDTIYAIIYGKFLMAVAQGTLGGLGFWILGIPAPWFWGLLMGFLSFLPLVGASFVWGPVAVYLVIDGRLGAAIVLLLIGLIIIAPIESFLYPILVGHRLKLHNALVFLSVLGGLASFGPVGLVVGPAVLALTFGVLSLWRDRRAATLVAGEQTMKPQ